MKYILLTLIISLVACTPQKSLIKNTSNMEIKAFFKKFDSELYSQDYPTFKKGDYGYLLEDGTTFYAAGRRSHNGEEPYWYYRATPPQPAFYITYYQYYKKSRKLHFYGKCLGLNTGPLDVKIGIWRYYNENGVLIKEVDEDKKFGKFSYNEALVFLNKQKEFDTFLKKESILNLRTGENAKNTKFKFDQETRLWTLEVINDINHLWSRGWRYIINTDTGELIKKERISDDSLYFDSALDKMREENKALEKKEIGKPISKVGNITEGSNIHQVYKGKAYTKAEWQEYVSTLSWLERQLLS